MFLFNLYKKWHIKIDECSFGGICVMEYFLVWIIDFLADKWISQPLEL